MSAPEAFTVNVPLSSDALPAAATLPMSWLVHSPLPPDGAPGTGDFLPVTSFSTLVKKVKGASAHTVTLTVNEAATSYFRFSGQGTITSGGGNTANWQIYVDPVVIELEKKGSGYFEFYSEDVDGNVEATKLELLQ